MNALLRQDSPVTLGKEGVQVLIMHTHGTEAYTPSAAHPYAASGEYRTTDSSANVLRVGQEICDILNQRGISAIHSTTLNDYPAYNGSYNRALKDINRFAEKHPSITLVIDVHRDAIATGNTYYKTAAQVDGKQTAQLMFVTGTDAGGLSHTGWRDNLTFQAQLHHRLNSTFPGIMRPLSLRASRFNQHVRTGSMLLEVGSCGNTLEEALAAAEIFANTLADILLG
jgi:stage II sporulation protein P